MKLSIEQRLLSRTTEDLETGCWNCTYKCAPGGHPMIWIEGRLYYVSNVALALWGTPLKEGEQANHTCHNPRCINPDHIYAGTQKDNMRDMVKAGRQNPARGDKHGLRKYPEKAARGDRHGSHTYPENVPRGEKHGKAKITKQQAMEIISYKQQKCRIVDVARFMKIPYDIVRKIYRGYTWKYLTLGKGY